MACELTSGYTKPNCSNIGGIKSVCAINIDNVDFTIQENTVVGFSNSSTAYRLALDINSGYANQTPTSSRENNSTIYLQEVMAMLKDDEKTTEQQVAILSEGYFAIVVEYRNGKNKVFGAINGLKSTTNNMNSGQNGGDLNGNTLVWAGEEDSIAPHISNTLLSDLLTATS